MRFLRQSLIGLVLAALTLGLLAYAGSIVSGAVQERLARDANTPPARERVFAVGVIRAEASTETPVLEAFGEVQSRRTLELRAAASGRVIELADGFEDGGEVEQGQILVRIDPANAEAELARAEADLMDAEAELRDADRALVLARDEEAAAQEQADLRTRAFQRQVDLAERGVGTAAAVEEAELAASSARQAVLARRQVVTSTEARIDQGRTRLARARIALDEAQRTVDDTTVIAPFDGTLNETDLVAGRLVSGNEKLGGACGSQCARGGVSRLDRAIHSLVGGRGQRDACANDRDIERCRYRPDGDRNRQPSQCRRRRHADRAACLCPPRQRRWLQTR